MASSGIPQRRKPRQWANYANEVIVHNLCDGFGFRKIMATVVAH
jgi:hypothetical protein